MSDLTANHPIATCEAGLVRAFMAEHALRAGANRHLQRVLDEAPPDAAQVAGAIRAARAVSFEDLIVGFELLISPDERRRDGAVFTPAPIARYLAHATIGADTSSILDPSCGAGALLAAATRRAAATTGRRVGDVATHMICGVDVRADNIRRAQMLLGLLCAHAGDDAPEAGAQLVVADALTLDYAQRFAHVATGGGFDAIVGNPPYVRYQEMDDATRARLSGMAGIGGGNPNLYFAFFPLGRRLLAPAGRLAYISPNSFFHLRAARGLREWFTQTGFIREIVDFGDTLVFDALAYTAITICSHRGDGPVRYRTETDPARLGSAGVGEPVDPADLSAQRWRPRVGASGALLRHLDAVGSVRLGEVATLRGGLATLRDRLFFIDDPAGAPALNATHEGARFAVEREITRPCVRISDHPDAASLAGNTRRIIYPYEPDATGRPVVMDEAHLRERFPGAYRYLCAIRPQLALRDRGRKTYPAWFAYGRSQGLVPSGPALLAPLYGREARFLADATPGRLFCNGQALVARDPEGSVWSLALLGALLHRSPVVAFIMANTANRIAGGYWQYSRALLEALPLPDVDADLAAAILRAPDEPTRLGFICDAYRLTGAQRALLGA